MIAVIGASLGGTIAAWSAARAGAQVTLVAAPGWLGGQLTAQGVPPDEHARIEHSGASQSYRKFRERLRASYLAQPDFLNRSAMTEGLNPGDGWVSRLCVEPAIAARLLDAMLAPEIASGNLRILRGMPAAASRRGPRLESVTLDTGETLRASLFLDGTDTGELLHLAELPYRVGKESQAEFGEALAPAQADPLDQQPVTAVIALRRHRTAGPVTPPPPDYEFWRAHRLPHYEHQLFSEFLPGHAAGESKAFAFLADQESDSTLDLWRYRRVIASHQWRDAREEVSLINWAQNDYALQPLLDGPRSQAEVEAAARGLSLCLLHWLQTEAGHPELQPAPDIFGSANGLAPQIYVRESRRIVAQHTLRAGELGQPVDDSVGIAWYAMDMHPTVISGQGLNASVPPFELPLRSFLPADCDNLLPACKNLGVTHLVNACTRVHPAEWLIGEVAGHLAALAAERGVAPAALSVPEVQARLQAAGIPNRW